MYNLSQRNRTFLFALALMLFVSADNAAQKLDHVLGDILVELPSGKNIAPVTRDLQRTVTGEVKVKQIIREPKNVWLLSIDHNRNNENHLLAQIKSNPLVYNAQKNHVTISRAIPNDPRFTSQWQYINDGTDGGIVNADLDMDLAWDITTGGITAAGDTIVVCIIDDGANLEHVDLRRNIWKNHAEIPDNNIDDDNNGYVDDYLGWNAYQGGDNVTQDGSHGTPVAGIVGAVGNNETGVAGVNWNIKLMIVEGGTPESSALASYAYAYNMRKRYNDSDGAEGAFVVATNSSWGQDRGKPEDAPIWCDFYNVMGEVGILSCGATANADLDVDTEGDLPTACGSDYLLSVTNIRRNDFLDNAAGFGQRTIDVGAYGEETYTLSKNNYSTFGGTSGATPHVTGIIGLLYSIDCSNFIASAKSDPSQTALAVKDYVLNGTVPIQSLEDITVTGGRVNAYNALINATALCEATCTDGDGLYIDEVGLFDASASFLSADNTGNVEVRYRVEGTIPWSTEIAQGDKVFFEDLDACSTYEYQSRTICNDPNQPYGFTKIFRTEGCCAAPTLVDIDVQEDFATVTWTEVVGANQVTVEYKETTSSDWNSLSLDGMTTEITIPNIQVCTAYDFRLMATCDITDRESEFSATQFSGPCGNCTADYCEIEPKDTSDEWIESVTIENVFTNTSGNNGGYGSFVGNIDIDLEKSNFYTIRLTPGYSAGAFTEFFSVYIDYNQDGEWSEQEKPFVDLQAVDSETSGSFVIPATATLGITRMRVIMRFSERNENSCDNDTWVYGEYEDYCVNILPPSTCPEQLEVISNIDSTSSSLAFNISNSSKIDSFVVEYVSAAGTPNSQIFQSNEILLQNLEVCTTYDITFRATCTDGNEVEGSTQLKTSCSTSTVNIEEDLVTIFPNPSQFALQIKYSTSMSISQVEILNTSGQIVSTAKINSSENIIRVPDSEAMVAGIYFVKISTDRGVILKKWLKSN